MGTLKAPFKVRRRVGIGNTPTDALRAEHEAVLAYLESSLGG